MSASSRSAASSSRSSTPGGAKRSASSPPDAPAGRNSGPTTRHTAEELAQLPSDIDWARLRAMTEAEVEAAARADPDWERLLDLEGWTATVVVPPKKAPISIRLDEDVLAFFKASGPGYQKRINAVLRAFMEATARKEGDKA